MHCFTSVHLLTNTTGLQMCISAYSVLQPFVGAIWKKRQSQNRLRMRIWSVLNLRSEAVDINNI